MARVYKAGAVALVSQEESARVDVSRDGGRTDAYGESDKHDEPDERDEERKDTPEPARDCTDEDVKEATDRARVEASAVLKSAEEDAARLRAEAQTQKERLQNEAREEGYRTGMERANEELETLRSRFQEGADEILSEAEAQKDTLIAGLEPKVFKLCFEITEKILGYELDHNENAYLSMVRTALNGVKAENHVTLRVNPSEYVRFFKSKQVNLLTASGSITADVVNDPTVGYGGCHIETDSGVIDAGVNAQLEQIKSALGVHDSE